MVEKRPLYIQPSECLFLVFFPDAPSCFEMKKSLCTLIVLISTTIFNIYEV